MVGSSDRRDVSDAVITDELHRRHSRAADLAGENQTLHELVEALGDEPDSVQLRLAVAAMNLTRSESAGISLLEAGGEQRQLRWAAVAGALAPNANSMLPRDASPCGAAIARGEVLLFREADRVFPALGDVQPRIHEHLLAPFGVDGAPTGTVWAVKHTPDGRFEREDARILRSLARFASAVHRTIHSQQAALRESELRLRHIIDSAAEYAIITVDSERRILSWNLGAERLLGYSEAEALGRSGDIFFSAEDRAAGEPEREMQMAREEGRAADERWHVRKDGSRFWGSGVMLPMQDDQLRYFVKIFRDRTDERQAEERRKLLVHELNHRVKNTLATVQAIASQTFRSRRIAADEKERFHSRLRSLAEAHELLTRESWERADLREVVRTALNAFRADDGGAFDIDGPSLHVAPQIALSLAMALHELATNATKYGALSQEGGRVEVSWRIENGDENARLHFRWRESGGPAVSPPTRKGFGSQLIERSLAADFGDRIRIEFAPGGVVCTIDAPVRRLRSGYAEPIGPPGNDRQE